MPLFAQALNGILLCEAERRYRPKGIKPIARRYAEGKKQRRASRGQ
jgi:hypothetical protein